MAQVSFDTNETDFELSGALQGRRRKVIPCAAGGPWEKRLASR